MKRCRLLTPDSQVPAQPVPLISGGDTPDPLWEEKKPAEG